MLRSTANAIAFGACLLAFASLDAVPAPIARAAIAVALGTLVTVVAYGHPTFLSVGIGAVSPLLFALIEKHSLGLAAMAMCFAWLMPRLVLAESKTRLAVLASITVAASLVAGFTFAAYIDGAWAVHAASCLFAGSCLSLVGLFPVETHVSFALRTAAHAIDSDARDALERAARVHRLSERKSPSKKWRALIRLADERAAAQRGTSANGDAARKELDLRIAELVEELAPREPVVSSAGEDRPQASTTAPMPVVVTEPSPVAADPASETPAETPVEVSFESHGPDPADTTAE
jgi:hypothetical protein